VATDLKKPHLKKGKKVDSIYIYYTIHYDKVIQNKTSAVSGFSTFGRHWIHSSCGWHRHTTDAMDLSGSRCWSVSSMKQRGDGSWDSRAVLRRQSRQRKRSAVEKGEKYYGVWVGKRV